ncbi:hypothetical protein LPU83_pLPU83c_0346 (plasmid) [Rhizobium favelukesii]|uniref:Uncharacterized protein n=1 Tax=Rhizobium favelukesii TaxID=348824 RepID=W6RPX9_9HYPH|nr:hypothetical protein LPU83_pLPU83c_0346 [Rhizobium favelukesii]
MLLSLSGREKAPLGSRGKVRAERHVPKAVNKKRKRRTLCHGSLSAKIETARGIDNLLQLLRVAHALLIKLDGDRGDAIRLLGARLYSEIFASRIENCVTFAQVIRIQGFIVATELFSRHHNILHEEHLFCHP